MTGFSSSGGNIHSGCGLSGAFFFFFFRGGSEPCAGSSNSGLISTDGFFDLVGISIVEGVVHCDKLVIAEPKENRNRDKPARARVDPLAWWC